MPVSRLLKAHLKQILGLEEAAVRRLFATYRQAELELTARIAALEAAGAGESFTASHLAVIRAQVDDALRVMWQAHGRDLRAAFQEALTTGSTQAHAEIVDLESRFGDLGLADRVKMVPPVVPAQQVAFLADEQNLLLSRFRAGLFTDISRQLSMSMLAGEGIGQAAQRVGRVMQGQRYQLERIARTEINHAANVGHHSTIRSVADEFPEMGLKKQWSAHLDARVCPVCRSLHLQVRATKEMFSASNGWQGLYGPCHPNDRCRVMPYSERWEARSVKKIADEAPAAERKNVFERVRVGTHIRAIHTNLSRNQQRDVLRGLTQANALEFLERHPIEAVHLEPKLKAPNGKTILGMYVLDRLRADFNHIYVNSSRPKGTWARTFRPGKVWSVSQAGRTRTDAMKRTLVHELGHHVMRVAGPDGRSALVSAIASGRAKPITPYAGSDADEYFAECFAAYVFHPKALQLHDPEGYNLIREVRQLVRMPL